MLLYLGRNKLAAKRVRSKTANKLDETRADIDALKERREELMEERKRLIERINRQRQELVINSRTAIAGAIIGLLLVFLQFKEFELYWGALFFLRSVHTFS